MAVLHFHSTNAQILQQNISDVCAVGGFASCQEIQQMCPIHSLWMLREHPKHLLSFQIQGSTRKVKMLSRL